MPCSTIARFNFVVFQIDVNSHILRIFNDFVLHKNDRCLRTLKIEQIIRNIL